MKVLLTKCLSGTPLSGEEAEQAMELMITGEATEAQISSFLTLLKMRGESAEEIAGFAAGMRRHMEKLKADGPVIDTCGTGGDGSSTFNISTAAAIVAASGGVKVAKHGNRAMSSKSGSADVLEKLSIPFQSQPEEAANTLQQTNLCFLFAPYYHQSMKHVAKVRKDIGFRTVFNLLGPLANPAGASRQVIGVFSAEYAEKMGKALLSLGTEHALLVAGQDGLDEITITGSTDIIEIKNGSFSRYTVTPEELGVERGPLHSLQAASPAESAEKILAVFENKSSLAERNIVALNAGASFYVAGKTSTLREGVALALAEIEKGSPLRKLAELRLGKEVSAC
ncbi:anthranilate phosphoribosyltransferase [Bacillus lacus]|uniref:Anthranilate phosphoribosyltransferase n=1 Tax=Metabacillus lacus TaxID=1983721 RepID=A0A7X2IWF1_9BACI|nr:anthranilate phosphoribosyltransferase [Metabacillus lacus]MRX70995.1 anthranilate phosphoribosyltransferase [Metabacillus lacus]